MISRFGNILKINSVSFIVIYFFIKIKIDLIQTILSYYQVAIYLQADGIRRVYK